MRVDAQAQDLIKMGTYLLMMRLKFMVCSSG